MSDDYQPPLIEVIASAITQVALEDLSAAGWVAWDDSPIKALAQAVSYGQADTNLRALDVTDAFFEETVTAFGRPQREAVSAQVTGTITASDSAAHTLLAGSTFVLTTTAGDISLWDTVDDVPFTGGSTAAGAVKLVSQVPGDEFNDLTGTLTLYQPVETWFGTGTVAAPSFGGVAAEDPVEYREKGARYLRTILPRFVTADDLEAFVLDAHDDIARAMITETFDPTDTTAGPLGTPKGLHFVVSPAKVNGDPVGVDPKAAINAIPKLSDVVLHIVDPAVRTVNVTATVIRRAEYSAAMTKAAAEDAIKAWLNPGAWGTDSTGEQSSWKAERVVRVKEAEAVLVRPLEVHYVNPAVPVTLQVVGADGSPQTTDRTLVGLAPLAKAGTVNVTVLDPA